MGAESPPLARGTPVYLLKSVHRPGITPARAGNTSGRGIPFLRLWDHPRLRGEHNREQMEAERKAGSPPPARGTLRWIHNASKSTGITPARAGNNISHINVYTYKQGSPPLTRGTLFEFIHILNKIGITPAHAGNTNEKEKEENNQRDHPRSRGEHADFFSSKAVNTGSPPLTRGTPAFC